MKFIEMFIAAGSSHAKISNNWLNFLYFNHFFILAPYPFYLPYLTRLFGAEKKQLMFYLSWMGPLLNLSSKINKN